MKYSREWSNQYCRNRRKKLFESGTCPICARYPITVGYKSCEHCRSKARAYNKANYGCKGIKIIPKPPMPVVCPLCESIPTIFYWHHWDDSDRRLGMWLCPYCNHIVELEERGFVDKYRELKSKAISELAIALQ